MPSSSQSPSLIEDRLFADDDAKRLTISPLLGKYYSGNSIDLRLGTKFVLTRPTDYSGADPLTVTADEVNSFLQIRWAKIGEKVVLQPRTFMLAATLEYVALPYDLSGSINNRSSYGRLGVFTVTAPTVHEGFKGCLTLELFNAGNSAVILTPGLRVAQLTLQLTDGLEAAVDSSGKYQLATEPEFPKFWEESDRQWLDQTRVRYQR